MEDLEVNSDVVEVLTLVCDVQMRNVLEQMVVEFVGAAYKYQNHKTDDCYLMVCCKNCRLRRLVVLGPPLTSRMKEDSAIGRVMDHTLVQYTARVAAETNVKHN